jgi:hypothetical protein
MFSFLRKRRRQPEVHRQPVIDFVHEQDGPLEQQLKQSLRNDLRSAGVQRAYLARVSYGDPGSYEVALCLITREDPALAARVGSVFAQLFGTNSHLDIMFPAPDQEARLAAVCRPFFTAEQDAG